MHASISFSWPHLPPIYIHSPSCTSPDHSHQNPIEKENRSIRETLKMCATREAWIVAASVGAVHAMKDQGFCRWSYTVRSIHQHAINNMRSFLLQAQKLSSSSSAVIFDKMNSEKKNQSEESLRKVMYLSCWGPYWQFDTYILVSPHVFLATNLIGFG